MIQLMEMHAARLLEASNSGNEVSIGISMLCSSLEGRAKSNRVRMSISIKDYIRVRRNSSQELFLQ